MGWRGAMRLRRVAPTLLIALAITGAPIGLRPVVERDETTKIAEAPRGEMRATVVPQSRVVEFLQPVPAAAAALPVPGVEASADATAQVAEIVALQLLAQGTELELGARQWAALASVTAEIQAVRHAYEASIAVATVREPGRSRIEIPAYAAAGDALRARFHAGLREQLGEANAAEILEQLGARLEGHFAGFGVSVQTLEVTGDMSRGNTDWQMTRTVKFWNSVEGDERLTTRRETHFPGREDPAGDSWGPLLSTLAAQLAAPAGS